MNNLMGYGAIKAIYEQGMRMPEDIYVVTFDVIDTTGADEALDDINQTTR